MPDFGAIDAADEKKSKKKKKQDDDDDEEETEGQKARREYAEQMVRSKFHLFCFFLCVCFWVLNG